MAIDVNGGGGSSGLSESSSDALVLDWSTSNDTETSDTDTPLYLRKQGTVVTMVIGGTGITNGGFTKDGTNNVYFDAFLPAAYRPLTYIVGTIYVSIGGTQSHAHVYVYPDGSIDIWQDANETGFTGSVAVVVYYSTSMTWVTA